jgi:FkbM family methyltransferase
MSVLASGRKDIVKFLLQPFMMTIRSGPLKGKRWCAAAGIRFIRGTYEEYKTNAYLRYLHGGDVVYDVGAHVGYYTALAATITGEGGKVYAFEPRPANFSYLKRHVRVNGLANVTPIEASVGSREGTARFDNETGTGTGHVDANGRLTVKMVCLDELHARGEIPLPDFLKIDVEGGETDVLKGAVAVIEQGRPVILVATHGDDQHAFVEAFLTERSYVYHVLDQGGAKGDIEILALPAEKNEDSTSR